MWWQEAHLWLGAWLSGVVPACSRPIYRSVGSCAVAWRLESSAHELHNLQRSWQRHHGSSRRRFRWGRCRRNTEPGPRRVCGAHGGRGCSKPKKELEVEARKLFSTTADRSPTYLQHMLNVPTPNVRGEATALAEKCQQAVMEAPGDMRLLMCMLQVGFLCHTAYDCPKKFSGKMVLAAIRQVMRAAGVAPTTQRSTWADAWLLASRGLPKATARKPWETVKLETLRDKTQPLRLGQVWFPLSKIVLGRAAGQWMRPVLQNMKRHWELMWRREPRTCVLLELACLLHHKLIHRVLPAAVLLNEESVKTMRRRVGATHGNRAFETVRALLNSGVFYRSSAPSPPGSSAKAATSTKSPPPESSANSPPEPPALRRVRVVVPARVARLPRQGRPPSPPEPRPRQSRPPSPPNSSAVPARVVLPSWFLESPPESSTKSPPKSSAVPARVVRHALFGVLMHHAESSTKSPPALSASPPESPASGTGRRLQLSASGLGLV